jgi:hypothetical protein
MEGVGTGEGLVDICLTDLDLDRGDLEADVGGFCLELILESMFE